ncbi:ABC transporter substrate-binding protein [Acidisphaera sp. L21]|jgi:peptide/nickel transport system substrate-binding protein|uniref:ABC transporter substrate-binding protein n=1 Tax=Acidisphaera sp. L21 TaxID=1641851 RepID=UPI00131D81EA|nr:ABC transporter substrate-binding protein [Acidisphaera sp. L21]
MHRRHFLAGSAAILAAPAIAHAASPRVLRFIPQADLTVLDPVWTTAYTTRNHGFAVFDTLYGLDSKFRPTPQMLAGAVKNADATEWRLGLRPGLKFHDGTPVLARDCVASIRRWAARDGFGQALMAASDDVVALNDETIQFRLKRPFPLLPDALGKSATNMCAIMPERLAQTDPFQELTEMVGSGPFRFVASERIPGSRVVYEKFDGYVPRPSGTPDWTAGPKLVNVDRVEWMVTPNPDAAAAALESGTVDWWEAPLPDMLARLKRVPAVALDVQNPTGQIPVMRMNQLHPPFDNPAIRRAVLSAVTQMDFLTAAVGDQALLKHVPAGFFCPGTPMATDSGMEAMTTPRDLAAATKAITDAGYKGEVVVVLTPQDVPMLKAVSDMGADLLRRLGLKVDVQDMDWGTILKRRDSQVAPDKGGWNVFHTFWDGLDQLNPATNVMLRGNGLAASPGWPSNPGIEAARDRWLAAADEAEQKRLAADIQKQAFEAVPYIPLGQSFSTTAYRGLTGVLDGFPLFWNLKKS